MRSLASFRADSPVPLAERAVGRGAGGIFARPESQGFVAQMATYGQIGTIHSIVWRLMTGVAKVDWKLWVRASSGLDEDRVQVQEGMHPALDLWCAPNPFMTSAQFVKNLIQHKKLTGELNVVVGYAGKIPLELWPIRPDRIEPIPDPYKFLAGWLYTGPDGDRVPLELNEILRVVEPDPLNPYRGKSAVAALIEDLDVERERRSWQKAFFRNSARPGGIIEIPRTLGDTEFQQLRDRWAEQHQGVNKAHRVALLEEGKWIETNVSMRDMQFTELDTNAIQKALIAFGMPKFAIGMVDDVNRANADASSALFAEWLIEPELDELKDWLNYQLLPLFGQDQNKRYEFDYESPVPENQEADLAAITAKSTALALLTAGGFDASDTEVWLDLPDIPYEKPVAPAPVIMPPTDPAQDPADPAQARVGGIDLAMRWVAEAHIDDNTCKPCLDNNGTTYRNRAAAYEDYPGGQGYKDCVGAEFGNQCRCVVSKRRSRS